MKVTLDKMKTVFTLSIALGIALNDLGADALLESQFTVRPGDSVTLPCTTSLNSSVDWYYHRTPFDGAQYVFSNYKVYDTYNRTFAVKKPTPHDYSMTTISGARLNDTGLYTCIEDGGLGNRHVMSLLVVADLPASLATTETPTDRPTYSIDTSNTAAYVVVISIEAIAIVVLIIALIVTLRRVKNRNEKGKNSAEAVHSDKGPENYHINATYRDDPEPPAAAVTAEHDRHDPPVDGPSVASMDKPHQPLSVLPVFTFVKSTDAGSQVRGLCVLGDRVYVARDDQSHIDIYDRHNLTHVGKLDVCGDQHPCCMALCPAEKRLYVTYYMAKRVCKVNPSDAATPAPTSWTTTSEADGISVSASRSVIVALRKEDKLDEFRPDGTLLRSIPMPDGVGQPRHAIQVCGGQLLVCFGHMSSTRGTCLLDEHGQLVRHVDSRTKHPLHLAVTDRGLVFVADFEGDHVTVLDSQLNYACEAVAASAGVTQPFRVCFDNAFRRVYVGEFAGRCRVLSYDIQ